MSTTYAIAPDAQRYEAVQCGRVVGFAAYPAVWTVARHGNRAWDGGRAEFAADRGLNGAGAASDRPRPGDAP